jgi:hypothetical protein
LLLAKMTKSLKKQLTRRWDMREGEGHVQWAFYQCWTDEGVLTSV